MSQRQYGVADQGTVIRIVDSTDGTPEQGVTSATAGLVLWYRRTGGTLQTDGGSVNNLATLDAAHNDWGILHIDDGYYRLDLPDAAWASGAAEVVIGGAATGMVVIGNEHQLVQWPATALPAAAADAAGGLPISDAGGLDLDTQLAETDEITAARMGALTDWIDAGRLDAILDAIAMAVGGLGGEAMRGTDGAALASAWTSALATTLGSYTAARAGYLDELGAANIPADVDTLLTRLSAARAGYLDELGPTNLPADVDDVLLDTGTTMPAQIAALENLSSSGAESACDAALTAFGAAKEGADGDTLETLSDQIDLVATAAKLLKYVQLLARSDAAIATDNATELTAINADGGSGAGDFDNGVDGLEAGRDNIGTAGAGLTGVFALDLASYEATAATGTTAGALLAAAATGLPLRVMAVVDNGDGTYTMTVKEADGSTTLASVTGADTYDSITEVAGP